MRGVERSVLAPLFIESILAAHLFAQGIPLSTLSGRVIAEDDAPIGGVTVRVVSSSLQGTREAATSTQGEFVLPLLPPGDYQVTFSASGMATATRSVTLSAAAAMRFEQTLMPARVAESIDVSAAPSPPEPGMAISASMPQKLLERLPAGRTVRDAVLLAPGVNENGPKGAAFLEGLPHAVMISGAMSFENLYLINGVAANSSYRGDPQNLFIEDAIQETVVETGRITAEYGRFAGGVVNVVTRSGGNAVSGSFRTSFQNAAWAANDAYNESLGLDNRSSDAHETYEATLGFPIWKDRLWGFAAGRWADLFQGEQTRAAFQAGDIDPTPVPYSYGTNESRFEGKLTAAITGSYNLIASYIQNRVDETNWAFDRNILSTDALLSRRLPSSLLALNFHGIVTSRFFAEAQYSGGRSSVTQEGPLQADRIEGTFIGTDRGGFGAPISSGEPTNRANSDSWFVKLSYLLSTTRFGQHDLRGGYEWFRESILSSFNFSRSDYTIGAPTAILRGTQVFPVFPNDGRTLLTWLPLAAPGGWTQLVTRSAYIDDRLQAGAHWSFNLGLRYDRNADRAANGTIVSTASDWSPRLAVRFDPRGDGRIVLDAGYAQYVSGLHPNAANGSDSAAGNPASLNWFYLGPCINCDPFAPTESLLSKDEALRRLFAWFDGAGGTSRPVDFGFYPGLSQRRAAEGLRSPRALEYSVGASAALGTRGSLGANFVYRRYKDLYDSRIDRTTGTSPPDPFGNVYDVAVISNSDDIRRRYAGFQAQFRYQLASTVAAGGTYTWSRLTGNSVGELPCCTAAVPLFHLYPEYRQESWNYPTGYLTGSGEVFGGLSEDQRHRARVWFVWQAPTRAGRASLALLEAYDSGIGYDAVGDIDPRPYVENPGYRFPPVSVSYYFTKPAAFRTEDITSTNVALDWSIPLHRTLELFLHAQVTNLFNERGVVAVETFVQTNLDDPTLRPFDPFHEAPKQGVNYRTVADFGKPVSPDGYQPPRAFQFSAGLRF